MNKFFKILLTISVILSGIFSEVHALSSKTRKKASSQKWYKKKPKRTVKRPSRRTGKGKARGRRTRRAKRISPRALRSVALAQAALAPSARTVTLAPVTVPIQAQQVVQLQLLLTQAQDRLTQTEQLNNALNQQLQQTQTQLQQACAMPPVIQQDPQLVARLQTLQDDLNTVHGQVLRVEGEKHVLQQQLDLVRAQAQAQQARIDNMILPDPDLLLRIQELQRLLNENT